MGTILDKEGLKDWGKQLETIIKSVVPLLNEPDFSKSMYDLFYPIIISLEEKDTFSLYELEVKNMVRINEEIQNILAKNPQFNNEKYLNYFSSIFKRIEDYCFENDDVPDNIRLSTACYTKHLILKELRVNPNAAVPIKERLDNLDKQIRRFNKGQDIEDEKLSEYFSEVFTIIHEITLGSQERYLFDEATIQKINQNLRPVYIDLTAPDLLTLLVVNKWKSQQPLIDWKGKQKALFYLIYILNNKKDDLPTGGNILELIMTIFTIKGERLDFENIRKQFSSLRPSFQFEEKFLLKCYKDIDILLK